MTGGDNPLDQVDVGFGDATVSLLDIDGDGDLDAFVSTSEYSYDYYSGGGSFSGKIKYFRNTGSKTEPEFKEITGKNNPLNGIESGTDQVSFFDIDKDGDQDAFVGNTLFLNEGSVTKPKFVETTPENNPLNGILGHPNFADLDGDGDQDALISGDSLRVLLNQGDNSFVELSGETNPFNNLSLGGNVRPSFADLDNDGDVDGLVGQENKIIFFENLDIDVNEAPVAGNDNIVTVKNAAIIVSDFLFNDADPEGENISLDKFDSTSKKGGEVIQVGDDFVYIPKNNFTGQDSFTYTISDESGLSSVAKVSIFVATNGKDNLKGDQQDNLINGFGGNDNLKGLDGNDTLIGDLGNDVLDGGKGADLLDGGQGNDTYIVDDQNDYVREASSKGNDTIKSSVTYTLPSEVEHLILTGSKKIDGTGNFFDNKITGNNGNNQLFGGFGGNDTLDGGKGNDTLDGSWGDDLLTGGAGKDTFVLGLGSDTISDWKEGDLLDLPETLGFADLTIAADPVNSKNVLILVTGTPDLLATLNNVDLTSVSLTTTDFI